MQKPKTIQGYLTLLNNVSMIIPKDLEGYDQLHDNLKPLIDCIGSDIDNSVHNFIFNSSVEDEYRIEIGENPFNFKYNFGEIISNKKYPNT